MAKFEKWIEQGKRRYGRIYGSPPNYTTYQNLPQDSGNWTSGRYGTRENIGTNRSIAAQTLEDWRKARVTKEQMQQLSATEALAIYKAKFWDGIKGDEHNSQIIAEMLADAKSSAGGNGIKAMQRALVALGENIGIDGVIGNQTIEAINRQVAKSEKKVYQQFYTELKNYYAGVANFATQLIKALEDDYPYNNPNVSEGAPKSKFRIWWVVGGSIILIVAVTFFIAKWK